MRVSAHVDRVLDASTAATVVDVGEGAGVAAAGVVASSSVGEPLVTSTEANTELSSLCNSVTKPSGQLFRMQIQHRKLVQSFNYMQIQPKKQNLLPSVTVVSKDSLA